jgi:hypothetical protein
MRRRLPSRSSANLGLAHSAQRTDLDESDETKFLANFNAGPDVDFELGLDFDW